jgi:hypothetical protein
MAQSDKNQQPDVPPQRRNRAEIVGHNAVHAAAGAFSRAGFSEPTLVMRWPDIVGMEVARIARPIRLTQGATGGVLTILSEPAAALFLQHESRALCERINTYLGRKTVAKLRFIQGSVRTLSRILPANPQLPRDAGIDDPARRFQGSESLQNALLSLARARHARSRSTSD